MGFKPRHWLAHKNCLNSFKSTTFASQVRLWAPQLAFTNALGPFQVISSIYWMNHVLSESLKLSCFSRQWLMSWAWQQLCWRAVHGTTTSHRVLNVLRLLLFFTDFSKAPFSPDYGFSAYENSLNLQREYYQEFACEFDLLYYPFDTQARLLITTTTTN